MCEQDAAEVASGEAGHTSVRPDVRTTVLACDRAQGCVCARPGARESWCARVREGASVRTVCVLAMASFLKIVSEPGAKS